MIKVRMQASHHRDVHGKCLFKLLFICLICTVCLLYRHMQEQKYIHISIGDYDLNILDTVTVRASEIHLNH